MAFTQAPQNQTYKSETIKFDDVAYYRSGDVATTQRDSAIWNMFYDRVTQENKQRETMLKKRPGLKATAYNLTKSAAGDDLRGYFYDVVSNRFYWCVNDKVYYVAPDTAATTNNPITLGTSSGYVGFCGYYQASTGKRFVAVSDGVELWLDEIGGTATEVTDGDMPTPHVPQPVELDGYLFLADANTNDLYNSDVDDPTAWTAGNYISAEMVGDHIIMLANHRNYIVAFGNASLEIFWDAAETTSPLKRNDSGYKNIGYVTGLAQVGDLTFFVGQDKNKNLAVFRMEGFKVEPVSNEVVNRSLQTLTTTDNVKSQANLNRNGYCISVDGHTFYCIVTGQTTWLYDIEEKMWYEWKGSDGNGLAIQAAWGMYNGAQYVAIDGQTYISLMSPALYQDFGNNFTCRIVTQDLTFGTMNWKTCHRLMIQGDTHAASGTSNLAVSWSDYDWADGGTGGPINLNLFSHSPFITRLGRFRNRSFKLEYADNYPLRLKQMELELNIGAV